jgi:hypothetical protein
VIAVAEEGESLRLAIADPFDATLRESLEAMLQRPLEYVVAAKRDILAVIERVYGFRTRSSSSSCAPSRS